MTSQCRKSSSVPGDVLLQNAVEEGAPPYQVIADDLVRHLTREVPHRPVPPAAEIARRYRIPNPTAQFVWRAASTRLRAPLHSAVGFQVSGQRPVWLRVADDLRARIYSGHLYGRLPSRAVLARQYGVAEGSVDKAARALVREGLLVAAGAQGTHVRPDAARRPTRARRWAITDRLPPQDRSYSS